VIAMTPPIPVVLLVLALLGIGWLTLDAVPVGLYASLTFRYTAIAGAIILAIFGASEA
jgi:hypothetical protein